MYIKHGHARSSVKNGISPTYRSWMSMIARCEQPTVNSYEIYGGAGITVCERWRNSFKAFLEDLGERPSGMTLDRYPDKNGNYEPGNVRWATHSEQMKNRRPYSAETRAKWSKALMGNKNQKRKTPLTNEMRRNISVAARLGWIKRKQNQQL